MVIDVPWYRGRKLWHVSLDSMEPVTVRAPDDATALIRAAIYYRVDWTKVGERLRFRVWSAGHA